MNNVEKVSNTDKRPAIAFDDAGEVGIMQIALRTYKTIWNNGELTVEEKILKLKSMDY